MCLKDHPHRAALEAFQRAHDDMMGRALEKWTEEDWAMAKWGCDPALDHLSDAELEALWPSVRDDVMARHVPVKTNRNSRGADPDQGVDGVTQGELQ